MGIGGTPLAILKGTWAVSVTSWLRVESTAAKALGLELVPWSFDTVSFGLVFADKHDFWNDSGQPFVVLHTKHIRPISLHAKAF